MATDLWRRPLQQKLLLSFTLKGWSRQTCVLRKLLPLSLYIIPPTILYIFWVASALYVEVWPQCLSGQLKKIIIMGITTTTTTTTIVLVYSYYNYIPQFVFCSIIITKILLKIIPLPPTTSSIFLSSCQSPSSRATLCDIYLSLKIIEYFIFSFAGPIRAFTT